MVLLIHHGLHKLYELTTSWFRGNHSVFTEEHIQHEVETLQ